MAARLPDPTKALKDFARALEPVTEQFKKIGDLFPAVREALEDVYPDGYWEFFSAACCAVWVRRRSCSIASGMDGEAHLAGLILAAESQTHAWKELDRLADELGIDHGWRSEAVRDAEGMDEDDLLEAMRESEHAEGGIPAVVLVDDVMSS